MTVPRVLLLPHHKELIVRSTISDEVAAARGYYSAETERRARIAA